MKPLRNLLLALAAAAALVTSSLATVTSDPIKTGVGQVRDLGNFTYATLPAASTRSQLEAIATDLGTNGTRLRSNGTRWRPVNGDSVLVALGAAIPAIANTETIVLQTLVPAGAWQTNDVLRIWLAISKSGLTDSGNLVVRIGTAGTTADTAVMTITAALGASAQTYGATFDFKLASATTVQRAGTVATNSGAYAGTSGTAPPAVATITDASANALYVTVTLASSGATNTLAMQSGQIQLLTP